MAFAPLGPLVGTLRGAYQIGRVGYRVAPWAIGGLAVRNYMMGTDHWRSGMHQDFADGPAQNTRSKKRDREHNLIQHDYPGSKPDVGDGNLRGSKKAKPSVPVVSPVGNKTDSSGVQIISGSGKKVKMSAHKRLGDCALYIRPRRFDKNVYTVDSFRSNRTFILNSDPSLNDWEYGCYWNTATQLLGMREIMKTRMHPVDATSVYTAEDFYQIKDIHNFVAQNNGNTSLKLVIYDVKYKKKCNIALSSLRDDVSWETGYATGAVTTNNFTSIVDKTYRSFNPFAHRKKFRSYVKCIKKRACILEPGARVSFSSKVLGPMNINTEYLNEELTVVPSTSTGFANGQTTVNDFIPGWFRGVLFQVLGNTVGEAATVDNITFSGGRVDIVEEIIQSYCIGRKSRSYCFYTQIAFNANDNADNGEPNTVASGYRTIGTLLPTVAAGSFNFVNPETEDGETKQEGV
jgi:hypothetical protein